MASYVENVIGKIFNSSFKILFAYVAV